VEWETIGSQRGWMKQAQYEDRDKVISKCNNCATINDQQATECSDCYEKDLTVMTMGEALNYPQAQPQGQPQAQPKAQPTKQRPPTNTPHPSMANRPNSDIYKNPAATWANK